MSDLRLNFLNDWGSTGSSAIGAAISLSLYPLLFCPKSKLTITRTANAHLHILLNKYFKEHTCILDFFYIYHKLILMLKTDLRSSSHEVYVLSQFG